MTNNFYYNSVTYRLPVKELIVEGEIENPGKVDFSSLRKHSVIVKEALSGSAQAGRFTGAYRYDGYSLFDILERRVVSKANATEFSRVIDMYIEVENGAGEKVIFSWGEIFYPNNLNRIIIASEVARIIPSKTKELWTVPEESRIIAGNDLITERNISSPVKITVRSYPRSYRVNRGLSPMYSGHIELCTSDGISGEINGSARRLNSVTYNSIFYGRGRGIHSTEPFTGVMLKDMLTGYFPVNRDRLRDGVVCIAGEDGYRCIYTYSELFNRNDQQEFLLIEGLPEEEGGLFRIFPSCDFFSDRAVKSVREIRAGW